MSSNWMLQIAQVIAERQGWTDLSYLGSGAFKDSFVVNTNTGRRALKLYRTRPDARSERELEAMRMCSHPNVAKFYGLYQTVESGVEYSYVVEEFLAGGSLKENLGAARFRIHAIVAGLLDAIAHIGARQLVHRDIKPANIVFRTENGDPVLIDFGLVRMLDRESLTPTIAVRGPCTPFYAAPEQLTNEKRLVDWRTDQFSLGVTASEVVFGRHPYWRGGAVEETIRAVADGNGPADWFLQVCKQLGSTVLPTMVRAEKEARWRTPAENAAAWDDEATAWRVETIGASTQPLS